MVMRDFGTTDFVGYEAGLMKGAMVVVGGLAAGLWVLGLYLLLRQTEEPPEAPRPGAHG